MNKEKKLKEKKTARLIFPYGSDDWDFTFITIYYIEQIHIGKFIRESNTKYLESLRINGSIQLCKDTQKAQIEKLNIEVNFIQSLQFIKTVDTIGV